MKAPRTFFHSNIRFLRERQALTQERLAGEMGIKRVKLHALESGKTVNPPVEDLVNFSEFFNVSVDGLLKVDLTKLDELKLRQLEAGKDVYMQGGKIRVLAITVDKTDKENIEYVPVKAKAGYAAGYGDPDFIATLPRFNLPNLPKQGTYRMFPTTGDSMLPIPENSDVLGRYVEDWTALKPGTLCIVILKGEQDFVFKSVSFQAGDKTLLLKSLNSTYASYTVQVDDVLEIWKFVKYQSAAVPQSGTTLDELRSHILEVKNILVKK